jgi:hypothetical protein
MPLPSVVRHPSWSPRAAPSDSSNPERVISRIARTVGSRRSGAIAVIVCALLGPLAVAPAQAVTQSSAGKLVGLYAASTMFSSAPEPIVTGILKVGSTLSVVDGDWQPSPVQLSYQWLRDGSAVDGATGNQHVLTGEDAGASMSVVATGAKAGYITTDRTSAETAPVSNGIISPAPTPTISGTAKVGSKLTASPGVWGPSPVTLQYQWYRSGAAISGATVSTYTPPRTDLGATLTVRVTGSKSGFTTVAKTSAPTSPLGFGTLTAPTPAITGTVRVGSKLTAVAGTWGPGSVVLTHQWYRSGVAISGATASTYVLAPTDLGALMTVKIAGKKSEFVSTTKTSPATVTVAGGVLSSAPTPTISGTPKVNVTLTAVPGTWGPGSVTLRYQWYRSGSVITGATASTYLLTANDLAKTITVRVTGSKTGYTSVAKTSAGTSAVAPGALTAPVSKITGTLKVASTVTAVAGTWAPGSVTLKYQWYRNGAAISGATASTYKLSSSDAGVSITVEVTGSKTGYTTATKASAATASIAKGTLTSTPVPTISGTVKVGSRLTANAGTWGPGPVTLAYQWYRSGSAISGATGSTYVLTSSEVGKTVTVKVTGSKTGYTSVAKTSRATAAATVPIRISGDGIRTVPGEVFRSVYVTASKSLDGCYWETVSGFSKSLGEIVNNDFGHGQRTMEIDATAVGVKTVRCGSWVRLEDIPTARKASIPGNGSWSVQKQIVPGLYRASDGTGGCYWKVSSDFTNSLGSIVVSDFTYAANPIVRINPYDTEFETSRCGSWARISD